MVSLACLVTVFLCTRVIIIIIYGICTFVKVNKIKKSVLIYFQSISLHVSWVLPGSRSKYIQLCFCTCCTTQGQCWLENVIMDAILTFLPINQTHRDWINFVASTESRMELSSNICIILQGLANKYASHLSVFCTTFMNWWCKYFILLRMQYNIQELDQDHVQSL